MITGKEILNINVDLIVPNRFQPRLTFDEVALNELANSIKEHGILQPLVLRKLGDKYEIIAGERRYKASTLIGLKEVPAIVIEVDDKKSSELAVVENIQRKELSALEEANSYKKLLDMGQLTQEELANKMGKTQSTIANKLRLLNLCPEVQNSILKNEISERHGRSLLQIKDFDQQRQILNKIISERMTVKDTDDYIKSLLSATTPSTQILTPAGTPVPLTQDNNIVNLNTISEPNFNVPNQNVVEVLDNLKIDNVNSNTFNDTEVIIEDRKEPLMNNEQNNIITPVVEKSLENTQVIEQPTNNRFFPSLEDQTVNMNVEQAPPVSQNEAINYVTVEPISSPTPSMGINTQPEVSPIPIINPITETPPIMNNPVEPVIIDTPLPKPPIIENMAETVQQPILTAQVSTPSRLGNAINKVRTIIQNIESEGYVVETQEADLEKEYQIILKIIK